jgi:crotonobetainyl-CoA:carnitine CoA-transferase CaiB-like acyl-CoA transferase
VALGALEAHFWESFCDLVSLPEALRVHYPEGEEAERQRAALEEIFLTRTRDEWAEAGERADIPLTAINSMQEAFDHPQLRHRQMLLHVDHAVEGRIPQLGFPIKLSDTPCEIRTPPPLLGEHNEELLKQVGYSESDVAAMRTSGVIA